MNDRRKYDDGQDTTRPGQPLGNYQITPEEMRVLDECNWESFMKRSLPLGSFLGVGTAMAIQNGILRPSARFGMAPKVTIAVVVGYFLGKVSYQRECAEKLMALPNSRIGQILRDVKEGKGAAPPMTMYGATQEDIYTDAGPGFSLDIDTDRPQFGDDMPITDGPPFSDQPISSKSMSYDDLRKRNREIYTDSRKDPYRIEPPPPIRQRGPRDSREPRAHTNIYGDVVD